MKHLIIVADDFGLSPEINDAVEMAHRRGILSAASLMVGGPAAADAVRRARAMPGLRVGLHLALVDADPTLSLERLRGLIDGSGRLRSDLVGLGLSLAASPNLRRRLRAEVEAQFREFAATGLALDHVNAHRHFHVHPLVASMILDRGPALGLRALRAPVEPRGLIRAAEPESKVTARPLETQFGRFLQARARAAGIKVASGVMGLRWSGAMTRRRWLALAPVLPEGVWEIFCHPATKDVFPGSAPGYRYTEELAALMDPDTMRCVAETGATRGGYADLAQAHTDAGTIYPGDGCFVTRIPNAVPGSLGQAGASE